MTGLVEIESQLRARLLSFPRPMRGALLGVLRLPSRERGETIGTLYRSGLAKQLSELLMDLEEDRVARTVVVGLLAEIAREDA